MKKTSIIIFLFINVFINSCIKNNKNVEIIKVDFKGKNSINLRTNVEKIICLETNEKSLFGNISKLRSGTVGFYILDEEISRSLFLFDFDGKFLNRVRNGNGPGECIRPISFIIDNECQIIILYDVMGKKIIQFDKYLNYLSHKYTNNFIVKNFEKTNDEKYFTQANFKFKQGCYSYVIYNNKFELERFLIPLEQDFLGYTFSSAISNFNNRILFLLPVDYYIYSYKDKKIIPTYYIDFGKYSLTKSDINKGKNYIREIVFEEEKIDYLDYLFETDLFISFSYLSRDRNNPSFCIYSKKTKRAYNLAFVLKNNNLPKGRIVGTINNNLILAVESNEMISWIPENNNYFKIKSKVKATDNNILMILSLKEL